MELEGLSEKVLGCAVAVHRELGPGLLESTYEECLAFELGENGVGFRRQVALPVRYRDVRIDCGYRIDLLIEDRMIVELKSVEGILPVHTAQLLTYLKLSGAKVGILLNFNVPMLKQGIQRIVN